MKKATGLGKRRAEQMEPAEADDPAQVYFALDDTADEIAQVAIMLAHAELCLEEEEKALPLLRAVVHECDRIGRLKDIIEGQVQEQEGGQDLDQEHDQEHGQEHETRSGTANHLSLGLESEQIESLRALTLTDEFYRVYGDALYRLAWMEEEKESPDVYNAAFLQSALEIYSDALQIFPASTSLQLSQARARCLACSTGEQMTRQLEHWISLIQTLAHGDARLPALLALLSFVTVASSAQLPALAEASPYRRIIDFATADDGEAANDPSVQLGVLELYDVLLDDLFEAEEYVQLETQLGHAQTIIDRLDLARISQEDVETYRGLVPRIAQIHLLKGALAEVQEAEAEAQEHYERAKLLWRELSQKLGTEIPEGIQAL